MERVLREDLLPVLSFAVGSANDPKGMAGMAHLVEHLICMELTYKNINLRESAGEITYLYTSFYIDFENKKVEDIIDIIQNMEITQEKLDREKNIIYQESMLTNIGVSCSTLLSSFLLSGVQDSRFATPTGILNITIEDVKEFIKTHFILDNSYILFEEHEDEEYVHKNEMWLSDILNNNKDFEEARISLFDKIINNDDLFIDHSEYLKERDNILHFTIFDTPQAKYIIDNEDHYKYSDDINRLLPIIRHELQEIYNFTIDITVHDGYFFFFILSSDKFKLEDLIDVLERNGIENAKTFFKKNIVIPMYHDYDFVNLNRVPYNTKLYSLKEKLEVYTRKENDNGSE